MTSGFFGINGSEFVLLILIVLVVLGPERLPEYAGKLARFVRQAKAYAEGAKTTLREQMGPEFDEIDWRQYDPRQYDPRRIVREALLDDGSDPDLAGATSVTEEPARQRSGRRYDETFTPFDVEAT